MENGVDDGDIIAQKSFSIEFEDSIKEVYEKATTASKDILDKVLNDIDNTIFTPQDKSKIEIYPQRKPEDGEIDWNQNSQKIYDNIRAQAPPYPCAFSTLNNIKLKIINSKVTEQNNHKYKAGEIININDRALVATKDKFIELGVIDDGEKQYQFQDYARTKNLWGGSFESKKS